MMNRRSFIRSAGALTAATALSQGTSAAPDSKEIWVSAKGGGEAGDGSQKRPYNSLIAARAALRRLRQTFPMSAFTVNLLGGDYFLAPDGLTLDLADSGSSASAPIVWRTAPGEKHPARLLAGSLMPVSAFHPVPQTDSAWSILPEEVHEKVVMADLGSLGISGYGRLPTLYRGEAPQLEVFFNGVPLPVAHYPNEGWAETTQIIDSGSAPRYGDTSNKPGVFACPVEPDRLSRWAAAPDAYLHGYFRHDWYDEIVRIGKIDPDAHTITTAVAVYYEIGHPDGAPKDRPSPPRRFVAQNLLCELDAPGEWYLDRQSGRLYLYPPSPLTPEVEIAVSISTKPTIAIEGASHLRVEGLSFAYTRGNAVQVTGGADVTIHKCLFDDIGDSGVIITGGSAHKVTECHLTRIGREGIILRGGNRKTLTPAGHRAEGNEVSFFGRRQRTYAGAIRLKGVGNAPIRRSFSAAITM